MALVDEDPSVDAGASDEEIFEALGRCGRCEVLTGVFKLSILFNRYPPEGQDALLEKRITALTYDHLEKEKIKGLQVISSLAVIFISCN